MLWLENWDYVIRPNFPYNTAKTHTRYYRCTVSISGDINEMKTTVCVWVDSISAHVFLDFVQDLSS